MKREQAIQFLRETFANVPELVEEYITEAEHQDGREYWQYFASAEELEGDFRIYQKVLEETD